MISPVSRGAFAHVLKTDQKAEHPARAGRFAVSVRNYLLLDALSTFLILCCTIPLMASLAGPRYFLGSKSAGCSTKCLRISAVIARRRSVSMFTLQTPYFVAVRIISSGTPCAPGMSPPNSLHFLTNSGRTVEAPWSTSGVSGISLWISFSRSKSRYGSPLNFVSPWLVPWQLPESQRWSFYEFSCFFRNSERSVSGVYIDVVFDAGQLTQLSFYGNALAVSVFYYLCVSFIFSSNGCLDPSIITDVNPSSTHFAG